jgi:glycosyltransferase involved in cell wall biosynthesis
VDNEESRGRRRFLDRWGTTLQIDDERHYAADGVRVVPARASAEPAVEDPAPAAASNSGEATGQGDLPSAGAHSIGSLASAFGGGSPSGPPHRTMTGREATGLVHPPSAGAHSIGSLASAFGGGSPSGPPHSPIAVQERGRERPLHVLFTMYGWTEEGGGTILPRQIARALVRRRHRVTVIYAAARTRPDKPPYHIEEHEEAGVRLFAVYNRPALFCDPEHPERDMDDPELRRITAALIGRLQPDVVHYHSLLGFSMGLTEDVSGAGIPSVYTSHNYWPLCPRMYLIQEDLNLCGGPSEDGAKCGACMGRLDKQSDYARRAATGRTMLARHVDRHLAVSRRVREIFVRNGHDPERIAVLHQQPETADEIHRRVQTCGTSRWGSTGARLASRAVGEVSGYGVGPPQMPNGPLRVGFIGSLLPQKGAHVLIRALQAFSPGELEAHLWGGGPQPYVDALQRMDGKRLATLHGGYTLERLPDILRELDVVVVPSIWEDCAPLVVEEILAAGVPVVGSRIGGIPDFVDDGVNGLLFDSHDAVDLASTLHRLRRSAALLGELRKGAVRRRDFDAYLDDLTGHYRDVVDLRGGTRRANDRCAPAQTAPADAIPGLAVVWEGSFFLHHSLAAINRAVCGELAGRGADLGLINFEKPTFDPLRDAATRALVERVGRRPDGPVQVHVRHRYPPDFSRPPEGRLAVILPWEFGPAPQAWVEGVTHSVDELWVPSQHVKDGFARSGVPADRIVVIPNGFDPTVLHPEAPATPLPTSKRFRFLYVGTRLGRKGFDVVLQAYLEEFGGADDVTLIIKDQAYYQDRLEDLVAQYRPSADTPEILYFGADVSPAQMAGFYRAADCLVHPFRGEGFGMPILEAMGCGRPVIVTDYGPVREFVPDDAGWFIPCQTITSPEARVERLRTTGPPVWAEPDRATLRKLMRHAVDHPEECRARGGRAATAAHARFTWAHVATRYAERLAALATAPPPPAARRGVAPLLEDGFALLRSDRSKDAAEIFLKAASIEPANVSALTGLAHCMLALGDNRSARLLLQEILVLDPGHAGARGALTALEADEALEEAPSPR